MNIRDNIITGALLSLVALHTQAGSLTVTEEFSAADNSKNRSSTLSHWTRGPIAKTTPKKYMDKKKK